MFHNNFSPLRLRFAISIVTVIASPLLSNAQVAAIYPSKYNQLHTLSYDGQVFEIGKAHRTLQTIVPSFDASDPQNSYAGVLMRDIQLESQNLSDKNLRRLRGFAIQSDATSLYLMSLSSETNIVKYVASKNSLSPSDLTSLQDALKDLQLKTNSPSGGLQAFLVHTRAMKDAIEKPGYQIWWAFFADADDDSAYTKIAKDSVDAYGQFVPGLYSMYTKKGAQKGSKTKILLDSTTSEVDLPIPE